MLYCTVYTGGACDDDVAEVCLLVPVPTAPHDAEPVGRIWTQVVHGDRRHVDADLVYAHRLPVRVQPALLLVPQSTHAGDKFGWLGHAMH